VFAPARLLPFHPEIRDGSLNRDEQSAEAEQEKADCYAQQTGSELILEVRRENPFPPTDVA